MEPIATASHRPSRRNAAVPAPPSSSSLFSPRRPNTAAQPHTAFAPRTQRLRRRLSPLSPDAAVAASQAPPSSTSLLVLFVLVAYPVKLKNVGLLGLFSGNPERRRYAVHFIRRVTELRR